MLRTTEYRSGTENIFLHSEIYNCFDCGVFFFAKTIRQFYCLSRYADVYHPQRRDSKQTKTNPKEIKIIFIKLHSRSTQHNRFS